jgi:hypothetical protein
MPKQPEELVMRILRSIQSTLAAHTKIWSDHTDRFVHIGERLGEIHDGMLAALGLASHTHVREDSIKKEINHLKKRVKHLEVFVK